MIDASDQWFKLGPLLVRERLAGVGNRMALRPDFAIFTAGWERRNLAWIEAIDVNVKEATILNFKVEAERSDVTGGQSGKFIDALSSNESKILNLRSSTEVRENLNIIKNLVRDRFSSSDTSIFIEITSLPKVYVQALVGWILLQGLHARVMVGYAEGIYPIGQESAVSSFGSAEFEVVPPMIGSVGPCREKRLFAILGAERANCYALIERIGPDYIHVFATRSAGHPQFDAAIDAQLAKISAEYSDKLVQNVDVDAFSPVALLSQIDIAKLDADPRICMTVFAAGTKPHAFAAALLGAAYPNLLNLRYRKVSKYTPREVEWKGRYFIYETVDLRSERLSRDDVWSG